jgi:hypothetical protein
MIRTTPTRVAAFTAPSSLSWSCFSGSWFWRIESKLSDQPQDLNSSCVSTAWPRRPALNALVVVDQARVVVGKDFSTISGACAAEGGRALCADLCEAPQRGADLPSPERTETLYESTDSHAAAGARAPTVRCATSRRRDRGRHAPCDRATRRWRLREDRIRPTAADKTSDTTWRRRRAFQSWE